MIAPIHTETVPFINSCEFIRGGRAQADERPRRRHLPNSDIVWIEGNVKRQYKCVSSDSAKMLIISIPFQS
jgi:hypothetical protein